MSGLCGVVSKTRCAELLYFGTDYHSHLGDQLAGMTILGDTFRRKIHDITQGPFKSRFQDFYPQMVGDLGIGIISDRDAQPLQIRSRFGTYSLAMTGLVENKNDLVDLLFHRGSVFTETSRGEVNSVELIAKVIETGNSLLDGIDRIYDLIQGSASILILTPEGIYAARDRLGRDSLILAENDGDYIVVSEMHAFANMGFRHVKDLGPGEIVLLKREGGYEILRQPGEVKQVCAFLWIYTGYPASTHEGISVERVRERCGEFLARRDDVQADFAAGVPDSGTGHAIGYAMGAGLPYRRAFMKYTPGYGRSYTPPSQEERDHIAKMKLIAVPEVIRGNRIVLCEDSIVRGTQLKNFAIQKLWEAGAKEIHMRPACPPSMFPCKFALSTRAKEELIARRAIKALEGEEPENLDRYIDQDSPSYQRMLDKIAELLNVTTLRYQRMEDMIAAIGLPREQLCTYCWTGQSLSYEYNPRQRELSLL
ncbi:MAG TPA: amidophosphoribosyltransferase [bacterium]|nr:amidophosphoribosyltransferase [bacterium]